MLPLLRNVFLTGILAAAPLQVVAQEAAPLLPTPPTEQLQNTPLQEAPRLEPMLSPREQALRNEEAARNAATQQNQQPQTQEAPPAAPPGSMAQAIQDNMTPQPAQMAYPQQPEITQQAPQQPSPVMPQALQPITPPPQAESAPTVTTATGFGSAGSGKSIPSGTQIMPLTSVANTGIDMRLDPDLVGGYDPNMPNIEALPYETQLRIRTEQIREQARQRAFEQAKRSVLPLETYEIRDVLGRLKDTQEAIQTPVRPAPTPGNVIRTISTDPAAKPKTIRLAAGNVTTLNIIDITGEPWPIVDIGFGGNFDVKPPEPGGHVIRITPLRDFARGNLVVRLLKQTTPITFSLQSGGEAVDYRFDARIPEYGPNAKIPLVDEGIQSIAGDRITTAFLEGVPPSGAEKLSVDGVDGHTSAWRFAGALYVRTPLSLLSPAWQGSATSADGMNVYVMGEAPVLLMSNKGNLVRARLSEIKK